jgi:predicted HD phosphohydrolase
MTVRRIHPIFASDIRKLGGIVTISTGRDHVEGSSHFTVQHVSRGGDVAFCSRPIADEDHALQAAQTLAEFTGAVVRR